MAQPAPLSHDVLPTISVVATTVAGTTAALVAAKRAADEYGARVALLVPQVSSPAPQPGRLIDATNWLVSRYEQIARDIGQPVQVRVCATRDAAAAAALLSPANGLLFIGGQTRWLRGSLWILLPICLVSALALVSQGVVQNLRPYDKAAVIDPQSVTAPGADGKPQTTIVKEQTIAQGPVASQEAIKQFGTNGGGFMNANSAHPFENPTPITNFIAMFAIFAISAGLTYTLGDITGSRGHGWAVWAAMMLLFAVGVTTAYWAEARGNPLLTAVGADQSVSVSSPGGNMEGKEVRFGIANTALFATATTDASCGAINGWHDSFTPLGGMVPLINMMLSEVVFGGVGAGMYGVLIYVILAVFIAGLMVGRTPEYLGKKVNAYDVQMAMLVVLIFPLLILTFTAISVVSQTFGVSSISNAGPHGLSEVIYAFTSAAANNGSAFGGLTTNTRWYNSTLGVNMLFGRFFMIIPMLAVAGSLGRKKRIPPSLGTFPVTTPLFTALLVSVIVIVGALTFFPALSLGPIVEHLLMAKGQVF